MKRKSEYHHIKLISIRRKLIHSLIVDAPNVYELIYFPFRINSNELKKNLEL